MTADSRCLCSLCKQPQAPCNNAVLMLFLSTSYEWGENKTSYEQLEMLALRFFVFQFQCVHFNEELWGI